MEFLLLYFDAGGVIVDLGCRSTLRHFYRGCGRFSCLLVRLWVQPQVRHHVPDGLLLLRTVDVSDVLPFGIGNGVVDGALSLYLGRVAFPILLVGVEPSEDLCRVDVLEKAVFIISSEDSLTHDVVEVVECHPVVTTPYAVVGDVHDLLVVERRRRRGELLYLQQVLRYRRDGGLPVVHRSEEPKRLEGVRTLGTVVDVPVRLADALILDGTQRVARQCLPQTLR